LGRLVKVVDQNGNIATYSYDAVGNLLSITRSALPGSNAPAVLNFTPQQGPVGTTVTIQGQGFSATPSGNTVQFNGTVAIVSTASATTLTATVPAGATTGPISVTVGGVTATTSNSFTVNTALVSITLSPAGSSMVAGGAQQFTAMGTYQGGTVANITSSVTWSSSSTSIATISNAGLATAGSVSGSTTITATLGSVHGSTSLAVTTVAGLKVTAPGSTSCVGVGTTFQLSALSAYSNDTTADVTASANWSSSNPSVATVSNAAGSQGLATALAGGVTTITATYGGSTASVPLTVSSLAQLSLWAQNDIGQIGAPGCASFAGNIFTVQGSGPGVGYGIDGFHFVYQPLSGNGSITARVTSLQGGSSNAEAGVIIRDTMSSTAAEAYMSFQSTGNAVFWDRLSDGASSNNAGYAGASLPYWVQVVRSGNTFTAYGSLNGVYWVQFGSSQTITMEDEVYIGLAVSSGNNSALATATFDNVSVSTTAVPAPAISGLSATAGPVGGQVEISGTGFGATQGSSVVLLSGSPVIVNSWSDTSITITIPAGATTGPMVVSVAPSMNDSNPVYFWVANQPLIGWLDLDVGQVGVAGSATFTNGVFTVQASGQWIWSTADGMHFVFQPMSGDGEITARVVSSAGTTNAEAGVMIRETLNAGSTNAYTIYQLDQNPPIKFLFRPSTGASTTALTNNFNTSLPYWVKVARSGNTFSGYASSDGVNWVQIGSSQTFTMAQTVYVGLALSSDNNSALDTATFDNVSVNGVVASLENALPLLCADITGRNRQGAAASSTNYADSTVRPTTEVLTSITRFSLAEDSGSEFGTIDFFGRFFYGLLEDPLLEFRWRASQDK
jgi:YD repeat-containing protein